MVRGAAPPGAGWAAGGHCLRGARGGRGATELLSGVRTQTQGPAAARGAGSEPDLEDAACATSPSARAPRRFQPEGVLRDRRTPLRSGRARGAGRRSHVGLSWRWRGVAARSKYLSLGLVCLHLNFSNQCTLLAVSAEPLLPHPDFSHDLHF